MRRDEVAVRRSEKRKRERERRGYLMKRLRMGFLCSEFSLYPDF